MTSAASTAATIVLAEPVFTIAEARKLTSFELAFPGPSG